MDKDRLQILISMCSYLVLVIGIGLSVGTYLNWLFVAKRLRHYSKVTGDAINLNM